MKIFTIGFTKKSAEEFFTRLKEAGVRRVVDVRLNNTSQIAGFAKSRDLKFFLRAIAGIDYLHLPDLAPTQDILDDFVKAKGAWSEYARRFAELMETRRIAETLTGELLDGDCLLCSEDTSEHCHRRLVAEHSQKHWADVEIVHLCGRASPDDLLRHVKRSYHILHNRLKYVTIEEMKQKPFPARTTLQLVRADDFTIRDTKSPSTEKHNWKGVVSSGDAPLN